MMNVLSQIAQGSQAPGWGFLESKDRAANTLIQEAQAEQIPEEMNYLQKKRGWEEEDRMRELSKRPMQDEKEAIELLSLAAGKIRWDNYADSRKHLIEVNGVSEAWLPESEKLEQQAAQEGLDPATYFEKIKPNLLYSLEQRNKMIDQETARAKIENDAATTVYREEQANQRTAATNASRITAASISAAGSSKKSSETAYVPLGNGKYQYMSVDKAGGETVPILRNGKPIVLSEKEVLIAEGKKAQSLINPYETRFLGKLGDSEGTRLTELKASALDSRNSLEIIRQARQQLEKGIYSGSAAQVKTSLDKWLQEAGIYVGGRKAANTETYASMMGLQVGKIIKAFGSGTGLSDADREYAEKIAAGKITLTEDSIRQLLDINERLSKFNIQEYNDQVQRARQNMEEQDYLKPIPMDVTTPNTPTHNPVSRFEIIKVE